MDTSPTEGFDAALTLTDTLDHLPANKRRELARVLEIIFFEVEQFRATKLSAKKAGGRILKVILYGSYARGDWVEDRLSGYRSDYDLLIVVNTESFVGEQELWLALEERLLQEQIAHRIETPVIPIVHSLHDVNDQLSRGRPFFVDIAKDGIVLYEEPGHPLAQPKALTEEETKAEARQYFEQWYLDASYCLKQAQNAILDGMHEPSLWNDWAVSYEVFRPDHSSSIKISRFRQRSVSVLKGLHAEAWHCAVARRRCSIPVPSRTKPKVSSASSSSPDCASPRMGIYRI